MSERPTPEEIAYEVAWHRKLGARTQASFANAIRAEREHYEARIAEVERTHVSKARVRDVAGALAVAAEQAMAADTDRPWCEGYRDGLRDALTRLKELGIDLGEDGGGDA